MNATFTPVPSTSFCACGVPAVANAVFVVCSASGSSRGFEGSVVQIWLFAGPVDGEPVFFAAAVADPDAIEMGRSG